MVKFYLSCLHAGKSLNLIVQENSHRVVYFIYILQRKIIGRGLMKKNLRLVIGN